jgi:rsbT antagonist protein RsbS
MYETQGFLVVPIQEELSKEAALQVQGTLLEQVHAKNVKGVIIELSGIKVIDGVLWEVFSKTSRMIKMLGSPAVITGLSPGVVASIIDLNLDITDLLTAMNLEDGLEILTQLTEPETDAEHDAEDEGNKHFPEVEEVNGLDNEKALDNNMAVKTFDLTS